MLDLPAGFEFRVGVAQKGRCQGMELGGVEGAAERRGFLLQAGCRKLDARKSAFLL